MADKLDVASLVTVARLRAICPTARDDILETIVTDAPTSFAAAGLVDHVGIAHFVAQIATEAAGLSRLDENLFYTTPGRLRAVFGKKLFPTMASEAPFLKNPEALANHVYAGKNGNAKDPNAGDGFAYRGSGLIQLTGRGNFRAVGKKIGMDLEGNPDLARESDSALAIALAFWTANNISAVAKDDSDEAVEKVTKRINPALVGLADRKAYFRKALKAFAPPKPLPAKTLKFLAALPAAAPAAAASELSGPQWVARFPTSRSIDDLSQPFRDGVRAFVAALDAAGASVSISATFRPKQRAYLMHWAWKIGKLGHNAAVVPPMSGVHIHWAHPTPAASRTAARQMVDAYGMVNIAALNSRHTESRAIDMTIKWKGKLKIKRADGAVAVIATAPRNGFNLELVAVGAGYGAVKLVSDPPHWSDDGR